MTQQTLELEAPAEEDRLEAMIRPAFVTVRDAVAAMKEENAALVFDYEDKKGNKEARSHVASLRKIKADVERCRKSAKAEAIEYGKRVDSVAKELTDEIGEMIDVHDAPLKAIKERQARNKERIEFCRAPSYAGETAESLSNRLKRIESFAAEENEPSEDLLQAITEATERLEAEITAAEAAEAQAAELEKLRQEKAAREAEEARQKAIEEAAARKAEQDRKARENAEKAAEIAKEREEQARAESERLRKELEDRSGRGLRRLRGGLKVAESGEGLEAAIAEAVGAFKAFDEKIRPESKANPIYSRLAEAIAKLETLHGEEEL